MSSLSACIQGIGLLGPGFDSWPAGTRVLQSEAAYRPERTVLPQAQMLPAAERRRAGRVIRLALAVGQEAVSAADADAHTLVTVFSSSGGDGDNCNQICATLASADRQLSPTRFHNSVHNAASGYWGIAYGCQSPSTALCAHDASFGAGLLEALAQLAAGAERVLLLAYDLDYPPPLHAKRPITDAFGVGLVLAAPTAAAAPRLHLSLSAAPAQRLPDAQLEALRTQVPAARCLPLLQLLARRQPGRVLIDYLDRVSMALEVEL